MAGSDGRKTVGGRPERRVVVVAYPRADLLDVAGPCEVFSLAADAIAEVGSAGGGDPGGYVVEVVSAVPGVLQVETACGVVLACRRGIDGWRGPVDTLLVAGGSGSREFAPDAPVLGWLRRMAPKVRRLGSICTGTFVLAAAGLLDGRRATTHWAFCDRLAREYPRVEVVPDPIFVRDGHISTSAGITAGMDLALAMVEEDHGRAVALRVAREMVMFVRRPGGQSQFSALLRLQAADREPLRELQAWVAEHLGEDLSVGRLAARACMSPRNFARVFARQVGATPARFVERLRVEAARRRLEETDAGLDRVARECGFGGPDSMRRSFLRVLRVAPSAYRGRFSAGPDGLGPDRRHLNLHTTT